MIITVFKISVSFFFFKRTFLKIFIYLREGEGMGQRERGERIPRGLPSGCEPDAGLDLITLRS